MRIFDINNQVLNDKSIGPVTSQCHDEMIFGYIPIEHKGHFGHQYTKQKSFSQESNNVYICDFNDINHGKDVVEYYKEQCTYNWNKNVVPIWNKLIDILQENNNVRQCELRRMLGFPVNLSNDNNQRDRLIAQFVSVGVNSGLLNTNKKNGGLYISLLNKNNIPEPEYNFTRKGKSKNEAYIFGILDNLIKKSNIDFKLKWGIALSKWKRAPYDIGILLNDEIVGLVEVDGEQHNRRIEYFHKTENDWSTRQRIDKEKTQLAEDEGIPLYRITENYLKKNKKHTIIRLLTNWINTLT